MPANLHIIPINDKIEHRADCECCNAYLDDGGLWIHHAKDKREQYERQNARGTKGKEWGIFEETWQGKLELIEG